MADDERTNQEEGIGGGNEPETEADAAQSQGEEVVADTAQTEQEVEPEADPTEEPALPPSMQSVMDGLESALPELNPTPRNDGWVEVFVPSDKWLNVARTLRDDSRLHFDFLSLLSAVDYGEKGFQIVYHLLSLSANKKLVVKIDVPDRENPVVPSAMEIWPTADWHEREAWDLMGVTFAGHSDLRRILMREDWIGHPLRKDYVDDRAPRERKTRETYSEYTAGSRQRTSEG